MATRRLIVHAGQPKTGTTAIQQFCAANRDALRRHGVLYPSAGRARGNHKFVLLDMLGRPQEEADRGAALRFRDEIEAASLPTVVISSEWMFGHLVAQGTASGVLRFLASCGLRPEILIYVRPDAERINSGYIQQTRRFVQADDMTTFARLAAERSSAAYPSLLRLREALGPRLRLLPYDRGIAEAGAVRSFLAAIGMSGDAIAAFGPERRANESVGPIAVAAARETLARLRQRGCEPSPQAQHLLAAALDDLVAQEPPEPAFQGLDDALAAAIDAQLSEPREQLSQIVWGRRWTDVFPPRDRRPRNVFDPATASAAELDRYRRFTAALAGLADALTAGRPPTSADGEPPRPTNRRGSA